MPILKTERSDFCGLDIQRLTISADTRLDEVRPDMSQYHLNLYESHHGQDGTLDSVTVMWRQFNDHATSKGHCQQTEDLMILRETARRNRYQRGPDTTVLLLSRPMLHRDYPTILTDDEVDAFVRGGAYFFGGNVVVPNGTPLARMIVTVHDTYGD